MTRVLVARSLLGRAIAVALAAHPDLEAIATAIPEKSMNAEPKLTASLSPKLFQRGVPFRVTPENVVAWKGQSGVGSRGRLVDGTGRFNPNARPARVEFYDLAALIQRANAGGENACKTVASPHFARTIRNRPRLKAMLGGVA